MEESPDVDRPCCDTATTLRLRSCGQETRRTNCERRALWHMPLCRSMASQKRRTLFRRLSRGRRTTVKRIAIRWCLRIPTRNRKYLHNRLAVGQGRVRKDAVGGSEIDSNDKLSGHGADGFLGFLYWTSFRIRPMLAPGRVPRVGLRKQRLRLSYFDFSG